MVYKMFAVVLLCLFISENLPNAASLEEPKYMMYFNTEVMVADDGQSKDFVDTSGVTVEWLNETTAAMHGVIKFLKELGDDTMVYVKLEKEVSGKTEIVATHEICDLCNEIGNEDSPYYNYLRSIGFPDQCPLDAGEYPIHEYIMDSDDFPLNSNTIGIYMATMDIYSNPSRDCAGDKTFLGSVQIGLAVEMA